MDSRPPDQTPLLARALTGVWTVARRESTGSARFRRVTFYRDGRFGARSVVGRVTVYGNWSLLASRSATDRTTPSAHAGDTLSGQLVLRFDGNAGPNAEYRVTMEGAPSGPMIWEDADAPHVRLVIARAGAIDAVLVGSWSHRGTEVSQDPYGLLSLELAPEGQYAMHLSGGVVRVGTWEFDRVAAHPRSIVEGTLRLDPVESVFPLERWSATLREGVALTLENDAAAGAVRLYRQGADLWARQIVGNWRFVAPIGAPVPQEISFRGDGSLEVLARPGSPRSHGRWTLAGVRRHPSALEGTLAMEIHVTGHATVREHWHVMLPFSRGGDLRFFSADGRHSLRYRRLFR